MIKILGLITARGGSKGIPRKNIRLLAGKPLLQYASETALGSKYLAKVILSTEDQEIATVGQKCGLQVPFMRPSELAQDNTPSLPVVQHALRWMESHGEHFDAVCLLQPTNPMRTTNDIDECIKLFEKSGADAAISVRPVPPEYNPHWVYYQDKKGRITLSTGEKDPIPRRQSLPSAFHRDGNTYVTRSEVLLEQNSLYGNYLVGYETKSQIHFNLDTEADWAAAEQFLSSQKPN